MIHNLIQTINECLSFFIFLQALKQIEKISEDLKHIDESTSNNESPDPASKPLLQHSMPSIGFSPCPPCATPTLSQSSHDSDPTINAPWRTRRRSNVLKHPKPEIHVDNSGTGKSTDASNAAYKSKSSPAPIAHPEITKSKLSPTVNTAQLRMSAEPRSPNPQRRVKKIDRQGSQVDIVISSPEGTNLPTAAHSRDIRLHKSPVPYVEQSDTSSSPAFADKSQGFNRSTFETAPVRRKAQNKSPLALTPRLESNVPTLDKTPMISVKNSPYQTPKPSAVVAPMKMEYVAKDRTQEDKMLVVKRDGSTATGRSSPKLPKLHQQLLFKDFPASGAVLPKQGSDEGKAKYDSSSNESWRMLSTDKSEEDRIKTDTPYFDPNTGYVPKVRAKKKDSFRNDQPDALNVGKTAVASSTKPHVGSAMASLGRGLVVMDRENTAVAPPPVVQPKPKVSIQKDADGNILVRPKDKEGKDTAISDRISPEKGGHSLAGRVGNVGKAGRDWIKKKLNFKDRKDSEQDSDEKIRATPSAGDSLDYGKRKSRTKIRERSSSLLRSFNGRSVTSRARDDKSTSEESNVSDGGVRRRESFLKRSKKKGKKVSVASTDPKTSSPTKSRPKRYTRSKTDVSTLEMKNFLTKFKVSQSNPKKPSVLKQFELKLLENEVKTIEDEKQLRKHNETRGENKKSLGNAETTSGASTKAQDEGYSGEDEGDYDNLEKGNDSTERLALPTIRQGNIPFREKRGPPVKTKPYYRRSMNDLHLIGNGTEMGDQGRFGANTTLWTKDEAELPAIDRQSTGVKEADEVCSRKGVSSLVDRFSAIQESKDEHGDDPAKPMNKTAGRYSFRVPSTGSNENGFENGALQRSHSMSSPSSTTAYWRKKRPVSLGVGFEEPEITKAAASQQSPSDAGFATWRDVVMSKPLETPTVNNARSPPSEYSFLKADWPKDAKDDLKPGRSRVLSEDMRRKAEMVEQVLAKGPRKPKMYRRADTQPISSVYTSSEEEEDASDTDRGFEEAFKPFLNDFKKTERTKRVELDPEDLEKVKARFIVVNIRALTVFHCDVFHHEHFYI